MRGIHRERDGVEHSGGGQVGSLAQFRDLDRSVDDIGEPHQLGQRRPEVVQHSAGLVCPIALQLRVDRLVHRGRRAVGVADQQEARDVPDGLEGEQLRGEFARVVLLDLYQFGGTVGAEDGQFGILEHLQQRAVDGLTPVHGLPHRRRGGLHVDLKVGEVLRPVERVAVDNDDHRLP